MTHFERKLIQAEERGILPVESLKRGTVYAVDRVYGEVYVRSKRGKLTLENILSFDEVREMAEIVEALC